MICSKVCILACLGCFLASPVQPQQPKSRGPLRVAIIGGGIGGTSCAHALRQGLGSNLSLTLFEMGEVGGRLATIEMAGHEYESGGSIIHSQNREMATFVKTLGLKATKKAGRLDHWSMSTFSLFNERQEVLFQLTEWTYFQNIQMILRYGLLSLYKMSAFISELLTNFTKIYPILDAGIGFSSTAEMLKHMETRSISSASLLNATSWSLDEAMRAQGMDPLLIHEIATAAVRVNYGQLPSDLHSLVGGVALAGAEGNLWSISGGNKQVPALLLERSQAEFVSAKVDLVKLNADGSFKVEYRNRMDDNVPYLWKEGGVGESVTELEAENMDGTFDVVVLATPLTNDKKQLEFQGFPRAFEFPGRYHRCVTTFVHGRLRSKYFDTNNINLVSPSNFYVSGDSKINSISLLVPVNYSFGMKIPEVWKIFSQTPLTDDDLNDIFRTREDIKIVDWLAYPEYTAHYQPDQLGNFTLHPGLFYINAIEWAASAMEMSALGGKNVANLILKQILKKPKKHETRYDEL
ncbi:prenylcysteine oxidase 1-like [Tigriopus californicus]|uniref:prenylcysteine oxidase 1-like n=1 Tax=Tigriopus californicus TaxID=6832 RepID=UPI0027DA417C|nr:prenylcysteine oxidase 1-like [Tigriopus californicus]|eukprot:TCALIF_01354-PA protein Name:"Similar to Pcyox1 Prenylcysteine oxidase (Mus musculus)" AED:0.05 eAED:0.05 QI:157/1/1/1/0.8/0.83/6/16/520